MSSLRPQGAPLPQALNSRCYSLALCVFSVTACEMGLGGRGGNGRNCSVPRTPRLCPHRRMAQEEGGSLSEVRARVGASHGITDLGHKLHFYDRWAPDYDQVNWPGSFPSLLLLAQPQLCYL